MIRLTVETRTFSDALAQMDEVHRAAGAAMASRLRGTYPDLTPDVLAAVVTEAARIDVPGVAPADVGIFLSIDIMAAAMVASVQQADGFLFLAATINALQTQARPADSPQ